MSLPEVSLMLPALPCQPVTGRNRRTGNPEGWFLGNQASSPKDCRVLLSVKQGPRSPRATDAKRGLSISVRNVRAGPAVGVLVSVSGPCGAATGSSWALGHHQWVNPGTRVAPAWVWLLGANALI